jgi:hypothetical protein
MPVVRKLSVEEVRTLEKRVKGQRKIIEEEYDSFLGEYGEGDYGEAELNPGENRVTVRNRLKAAAGRRDLELDFKRTKGNVLRFRVVSPNHNEPEAVEEALPAKTKGRGKKKA